MPHRNSSASASNSASNANQSNHSTAASVLMPPATHLLLLDRLARRRPGDGGDALIDLSRQRGACGAVAAAGRQVHITADDHERLYLPYPIWHSNMTVLAALSMADSLGLRTLDTGEVFDAKYFGGYHRGKAAGWRMRPERDRARPRPPGFSALRDGFGFLKAVGLGLADCVGGLSEVATAKIVAESRYRDKSYSCYYPSEEPFCFRCDKCFKKLLLRHVAEKTEVPKELFERFLSVPRLAALFDAPYLDWHHVWFYLFQKIRCRHWFALELQRQAREGPDLSALEKWYPKAVGDMEPDYADAVLENIGKRVRTMTPAEMELLENCEVPPLRRPSRAGRPPRPNPPAAAPEPDPGPATIPPETKALFRLLQAKLLTDPPPRWGPYRLDDVFLRPSDPGVCLWLSRVQEEAARPGEAVIARLFRIQRPGDRFLVRLGTLGLDFESPRPIGMDLLRPLVLSLSGVFKQARVESA